MKTGIYAIRHAETGKLYVGSAVNFASRWRVHRCHLRKGTHHSAHLQAAWDKHGEGAFVFEKMLVCSPDNLLMYEQIMVDGAKASDREFGYNVSPVVNSRAGMKHSEAAREKIKAARAKQVFSDETRARLSAAHKGRKMPDWFPAFMSERQKGFKHSDEAKAKISAAGVGREASVASREKRFGKMTYAAAQSVRELYAAGGRSQASLASEYGVDTSLISRIVRGTRWNCSIPEGVIK